MDRLIKKLWNWMQKWDAIWAVPLSFFIFWFIGFVLTAIFNVAIGSYDLAFIQPGFLTVSVAILLSTAAWWALRFQMKGLWNYWYSKTKSIISSATDFTQLTSWQRIIIVLSCFFLFYFSLVIIYLKFI